MKNPTAIYMCVNIYCTHIIILEEHKNNNYDNRANVYITININEKNKNNIVDNNTNNIMIITISTKIIIITIVNDCTTNNDICNNITLIVTVTTIMIFIMMAMTVIAIAKVIRGVATTAILIMIMLKRVKMMIRMA